MSEPSTRLTVQGPNAVTAAPPTVDELPGFRRRLCLVPEVRQIRCELEDDYHRMAVTVQHDGQMATGIDGAMPRVPWTTCSGALEQLRRTFVGVPLAGFPARAGDKRSNCTHLHDLAVLGAAHALDSEALTFDILVSDPVAGRRLAEIRCNGQRLLGWTDEPRASPEYNCIVEPPQLAGLGLDQLRPWIQSLPPVLREAARLLQWCAIVANGRRLSLERHADASLMGTGRCFSFQEERAGQARRILDIRDFSKNDSHLLARLT